MKDLRSFIEECVDGGGSGEDVADRVLKMLGEDRLRLYAEVSRLPVLSVYGRVLVAVLEDPQISQRALAIYLGFAESTVNRCVRSLVGDGILVKERVDRRVRYSLNVDYCVDHPDIRRIVNVLCPIFTG